MKKAKKLTCLLLVLSLVFVLAACGGGTSGSQSAGGGTSASQPAGGSSASMGGGTSAGGNATVAANGVKFQDLYNEVATLSGQDAYDYFMGVQDKGLTSAEIQDWFNQLPLSSANQQIHDIFVNDGMSYMYDMYPNGGTYQDYQFKMGDGMEIVGPTTGQNLKLPYADYVPIEGNTVGDPNTTYKIGAYLGTPLNPWSANLGDSGAWAGAQYDNVEFTLLQSQLLESSECSAAFDTFIAQGVDVIVTNPVDVSVVLTAAQQAWQAGIPTVTCDAVIGYENIGAEVAGNFNSNGSISALASLKKLHEEGSFEANMVLLRRPLGTATDSVRTGAFLKVMSYFPELSVLQSYHDNYIRDSDIANVEAALQAYDDIDIFFCAGSDPAIVAYESCKAANRLTRSNGEQVIIPCVDDTNESLALMEQGAFVSLATYTPCMGDVAVRAAILIAIGEDVPKQIMLPPTPSITPDGSDLFGIEMTTVEEWSQYAFGAEL